MKDQYFGDVNDYLKYGIIRALRASGWRVHVNWMLTPDDGRTDGKFTRYLSKPEDWRHFDPELFDFLREEVLERENRAVAGIERWSGMDAAFFNSLVPDARGARAEWSTELSDWMSDADLVFFDPDNGVEIPSCPIGRKGSGKFVAWQELVTAWDSGASLLVYQHFIHENREAFLERMASAFQRRLGALEVLVLRTSRVPFFLIPQDDHIEKAEKSAHVIGSTWEGKVRVEKPLDGYDRADAASV